MNPHDITSTITPRQVNIKEPLPRPESPQIRDATLNRGLTSLPPSLNEHDDEVELHEDTTSTIQPDIEHVYVEDDPRKWSARRKVRCTQPSLIKFSRLYNPCIELELGAGCCLCIW